MGGLETGGVEVALKSPDTRELVARIRARLPNAVQHLGPSLRLDRQRGVVERLGDDEWFEVRLQPQEYRVLQALVDAGGTPVGSWDLYERAFQGGHGGSADSGIEDTDAFKNRVWVCISNLRKKLDPDDRESYIQSVHGIGYRFQATDPNRSL